MYFSAFFVAVVSHNYGNGDRYPHPAKGSKHPVSLPWLGESPSTNKKSPIASPSKQPDLTSIVTKAFRAVLPIRPRFSRRVVSPIVLAALVKLVHFHRTCKKISHHILDSLLFTDCVPLGMGINE